jgi:hypothetical protein
MKLTDKFSTPVTWLVRVIGWSVSLITIWWLFSFYANMKLVNHVATCLETLKHRTGTGPASALTDAKDLLACLDKQAGFPEKFMYAPAKKAILSLPSVPCRYVGIWSASRGETMYRVTLMDDSRFIAEPLRDAAPAAQNLSGSWGVHEDRMIWLYDTGRLWPPDINPITYISETGFSLREADGSTTRYDLIEQVPSTSCTPGNSPAPMLTR